MTEPVTQASQPPEEVPPPLAEIATVEAILAIGQSIAAGTSIAALIALIGRTTSIRDESIEEFLDLVTGDLRTGLLGSTDLLVQSLGSQAEQVTASDNAFRRGSLVLNAIRRFQSAEMTQATRRRVLEGELTREEGLRQARQAALDREGRYAQAHVRAAQARLDAARAVQQAADEHGSVLGWYAILDDRTDPVCRKLHKTNFSVNRPPSVGWPGAVHGSSCRCWAGAPHRSRVSSYTVSVPEDSKAFQATYAGA